ncbi:MAG: serine dehydratase subunit alpha family protein, partial [Clostridia bacterium]|nr:serine dehydratase subunit alpha family protein [Clostridia bacterium]
MKKCIYKGYLSILKEELLPAMGCTEPISLAYAAALAKSALGALPDRVEISVSGNILKNVKSVIVPNTVCLKG